MAFERTRPYRGTDRRGGATTAALGETFALAGAVLLALVAALGFVASSHPVISVDRTAGLSELFETLSGSFAVGAFLFCLLRWRLSGEAVALWIGTATLVFGVVVIGVAEIGLPLVAEPDQLRALIPATYAAGVVGTLVLAVIAWGSPGVQASIRPWRVAVAALAFVGLAALVLDHLGVVARALTAVHPVTVQPGFRAAARATLSLPLAAVGLGCVIHGVLRNRTLLAWSGLAVSALAIGELSGALQRSAFDLWMPGGHFLRAVGFFLLMVGCSRDLQRSYADQRGRLFDSLLAMRTEETRRRGQRAGGRKRAHDLRGSLMAIEGAALTLQRHNEALSAESREKLTAMLSSEISRLQALVLDPSPAPAPFTLAESVRNAVDLAGGGGADVTVEDHASNPVIGSPADTTEVVRELVSTAIAEAGEETRALSVELTQEDEWGVVRVKFRPRGFPRHERRAILARRLAGRGDAGEDVTDAIGLHVAGQLVRDQGGELALHSRDDGELCFELRLPISTGTP